MDGESYRTKRGKTRYRPVVTEDEFAELDTTKMLRGGWRLQAPGEWSRPTGGGSGLSLDRQPIGCRS
jgi:hypothetical protein